jgi:hypothetical protein
MISHYDGKSIALAYSGFDERSRNPVGIFKKPGIGYALVASIIVDNNQRHFIRFLNLQPQ